MPLGLALFGCITSSAGYWLTNTYENNFTAVDDEKFSKYGFLFGSRLLEELPKQYYTDPVVRENAKRFVLKCINPELDANRNLLNAMVNAPDMWRFISGQTDPSLLVNPGRITLYTMPTGETRALPCVGATASDPAGALGRLEVDSIVGALADITLLGKKLFPGEVNPNFNLASLGAWETTMLGISRDSTETFRHYAMINILREANEENAGVSYGSTAAAAQMESGYRIMRVLAEGALPKIRNLIEAMIYAVFPVVFLIVVAAGAAGGKVLSTYAMTAVWVQLWAPLYAVINSFMHRSASEATLALTDGAGATIRHIPHMLSMSASDQAIAGLLTISVPAIALALVKGGAVAMSGVVSSLMSPGQSAAGRAGGEVAMGNISGGGVQWGNVNMHQANTAPTSLSGASRDTVRHADGATTTQYGFGDSSSAAGGSSAPVVDRSPTVSNLGAANATASSTVQQVASNASRTHAENAANFSAQRMSALAAAHAEGKQFLRSNTATSGIRDEGVIGDVARFNQAMDKANRLAASWREGEGLTQDQQMRVLAQAGLGFNKKGIKAGLEAMGAAQARHDDIINSAREYAANSGFSEQIRKAQDYGSRIAASSGSESARQATAGIRAEITKAERAESGTTTSLSRSQAYEEMARREASGGTSAGLNLANWILEQVGSGDRAEGNRIFSSLSESQQHSLAAGYARNYAHEQAGLLQPGNPEANASVMETADSTLPSPGSPADAAAENRSAVEGIGADFRASVPGNPSAPPSIQGMTPADVRRAVDGAGEAATVRLQGGAIAVAGEGGQTQGTVESRLHTADQEKKARDDLKKSLEGPNLKKALESPNLVKDLMERMNRSDTRK